MKITTRTTVTTIEATAEELRQGNTLADGLSRMLRGVFNGCCSSVEDVKEGEEDDCEED